MNSMYIEIIAIKLQKMSAFNNNITGYCEKQLFSR